MVSSQIKGNRLSGIISGIFLPVFLTIILFFFGYHRFAVPFIEERLLEAKKEMIRELTNSVWNLVSDYQQRVEKGELTLEEAQKRAASRVRKIRYGSEGKDYFWINDMQPVMIMHPYTSKLEGQDVSNYTDPEGKHLFEEFVDTVSRSGAGYVSYMWQWKDDSTNIVPKISYVRGFEEWDWIIGTGIYVEDVDEWINSITKNLNVVFSVILALVTVIGIYLVFRMFRVEKERNKAVKDLIHLQLLLGDIIDSMPSILIGIDRDLHITQWNHEAAKFTNKDPSQAIGQKLDSVFPLLSGYMDKIGVAIITREKLLIERIKWETKGENSCFDLVIYPLQSAQHNGAVLKIDNIDDKVRFEEMMIQTEKMLSVGGLAAGMAHEINNPLAGILQNINVIRNRIGEKLDANIAVAKELGIEFETIDKYMRKRDIYGMIDDIVVSGKRAAGIVDNMLSFSRGSESMFEFTDIPRLLENTLELAENDFDLKMKIDFKNIVINRDYEENIPKVYCERRKIQQVLFNVIKNGAEAINRRKDDCEPEISLRLKRENDKVRIEIGDNGIGMDESTRKRVFEPFFTTKNVGAGTGLGLSIAFFIIKENHEGTMLVESIKGKGSWFIIRLPIDKRELNE